MNRFKTSSRKRDRKFYEPKSVAPNSGLTDHYGRVYVTLPSGAIRLIKDIVTGPDDPRRGRK
jgi:hypothetical protein